MCGLAARRRWGMAAWEQANVARALTPHIRSKRFIGVARVPVRLMALALLTRTSRPPKCATASATALATRASSRTSTTSGRALPPAASTSAAAVWMVPGSFGWGSAVFAAMTTLAPSAAARRAMALPMPRLAPVMNRVLPLRSAMGRDASSMRTVPGGRSRRGFGSSRYYCTCRCPVSEIRIPIRRPSGPWRRCASST